MSRNQGLRHLLMLAAFAASAGLAGCGKQGVLEQPPPLFGARAKAEYYARRAQEEKDDAQRRQQQTQTTTGGSEQSSGDNAPKTKRDVKDPAQILTPASRAPIVGAPDPRGAPVQAAPNF
jgi:predicted small lipoprotein YifL